jgi:hypothetical protein
VLDVAGATSDDSPQTQMALAEFRRDLAVAALYGFSGGGYNVLRVINALKHAQRVCLRLVVVLGAPHSPMTWYRALGSRSIDSIRREATWTAHARRSRHRTSRAFEAAPAAETR